MKDLLLNSNVVIAEDEDGQVRGRLVVDDEGVVRFVPDEDAPAELVSA